MNLFEQAHEDRLERTAPLAARMRPRTLDEYVGQEHIVGPGRLLRRAIQADQLGSIILYGPPGTGKTTLAQVIANTTETHFIKLNAVLSGVKDIREAVAEAQNRAQLHGQRTTLFVDEVHRFNKAQQDALLPWVENGTVIFIGATTENPYFEVNKALVSRSRIFQLTELTSEHLRAIVHQTLTDPKRGYGHFTITIDDEALDHLVNVANGDARALLNALELAVETSSSPSEGEAGRGGESRITLAIAEESIQRRAVLYDKEGDYHYDTISAFIKSLRGSDPDAALYWMAKMLYAGEDPRFIFRRMIIFAGEDIGMADPNAMTVAISCSQAFDYVGLPEGRFPLAQACIYLATAPKSNTTMAIFDALSTVESEADSGVPNHLRDGNRDKEGFGHGEGYLYPHAFRDHWVAQQYLPTSLQGKVFYQPSNLGYEASIRVEVSRRREEQIAAMIEAEARGDVEGLGAEVLTYSPDDPERERWLMRTISEAGPQLGRERDRILDSARLARHGLVLDLKVGTGLLTWEALRRVPEGGVTALATSSEEAETIRQLADRLPELERPSIREGMSSHLAELLAESPDLRFDAIVGRNVLFDQPDKHTLLAAWLPFLQSDGVISLAERVGRAAQRLYDLVTWDEFEPELVEQIKKAEEAIYTDPENPQLNWQAEDLVQLFQEAGLTVTWQRAVESRPILVTDGLLNRWFTKSERSQRLSYAQHLNKVLSKEEVEQVQRHMSQALRNQQVAWKLESVFLIGRV
ncbi:MAG: AAA family ATPase [Chloroflexota bacterium]